MAEHRWTLDELRAAIEFLDGAFISGQRNRQIGIELLQALTTLNEPTLKVLAMLLPRHGCSCTD